MKIAITGGTGFVGRHLANRLIAEGHEVVLIARHAGQAGVVEAARATLRQLPAISRMRTFWQRHSQAARP